jgi:hypothetical protein
MSKQSWLTPFRLSKLFKILGGTLPMLIFATANVIDSYGGVNGDQSFQNCHSCVGITMLSPAEGWAYGDLPMIMHIHQSNQQWESLPLSNSGGINNLAFDSPDDGWAIATDDIHDNLIWQRILLHYHDGRWEDPHILAPASLYGIAMVTSNDGRAVGDNGTILHYDGMTWNQVPSGTTDSLQDISMLDASEGWAVGTKGTILHYLNRQWRLVDSPVQVVSEGVIMINGVDGWISGWGDTLLHYDGSKWQPVALPALPDITLTDFGRIAPVSANDFWIVGRHYHQSANSDLEEDRDYLFHYQNGEWEQETLPSKLRAEGVVVIGSDIWVTGSVGNETDRDGAVYFYHDTKWQLREWQRAPEPLPITLARIGVTLFVIIIMMVTAWLLLWTMRKEPDEFNMPRWISVVGFTGGFIAIAAAGLYVAEPLLFTTYQSGVRIDATLITALGACLALFSMAGNLIQQIRDERKRKKQKQLAPAEYWPPIGGL